MDALSEAIQKVGAAMYEAGKPASPDTSQGGSENQSNQNPGAADSSATDQNGTSAGLGFK